MSTSTPNAAPRLSVKAPEDVRVGIVTAQWNGHITNALKKGALETLEAAGVNIENDVDCFEVPGAVELTYGASHLIDSDLYDAVIVFGCVIRGGTPHFDYVCQSVTQGVTSLNVQYDVPVIFGVLTVDCEQDALDRAGGRLGNKGSEAAEAALAMVNFVRKVNDL